MLQVKRALPLLCLLAACPGGGGPSDGGDAGNIDICNDPATAQADPRCELNIAQTPAGDAGVPSQQFYIDHAGKTLWLWVHLPATVPAGDLFHIVAGYSAPATPVQLSINLLDASQKHSVRVLTAQQSALGKPGLIDYAFQLDSFTPAGTILWAEVTDAANTHFDVRNPFNIAMDLIPNPDQNVGVTPITFGAASPTGVQTGTCANGDAGACQGILSLSGQIDSFSVTVPGGGRQILYLDVTAPILTPVARYDLAYSVTNDAGTVINSGSVANQYTPPNLQAALLVNPPGGTYTISIFGLDPNVTPPGYSATGPADSRLTYTLNTALLTDVDANEPNDDFGQTLGNPAAQTTFGSPPQTVTLNGRLSYFGDRDLYLLHFPDTAGTATRLHYKLTAQTTGNRFPVINGPPDRQLNVDFDIPALPDGGTSAGVCLNDSAVCPTDPEYVNALIPDGGGLRFQSGLLNDLCINGDGDGGSLCLLSGREEAAAVATGFSPLQNFEGILPLLGSGKQDLWLDLKAAGGQYADDLPYTLTLTWETMPHALSSQANPLPFGTLGASNTTQSGALSVGFGYLVQYNLMEDPPIDVRGFNDYDAVPSTADVWEIGIPAGFQAAKYGATWGLGWTVSDPGGGTPAESLLLGVVFCTSPTSCTVMNGNNRVQGFPGALYYQAGADLPWYDPSGAGIFYPFSAFAPDWLTSMVAGGMSITASPSSCTCIQPNYLPAGKFYVTVAGADRTAWTDTSYSLSMSISSYPQSTGISGVTCPLGLPAPDAGPGVDAGPPPLTPGCRFIDGF